MKTTLHVFLASTVFICASNKLMADDCNPGKTIITHEVVQNEGDTEAPGVVGILNTDIIRGDNTDGTLCISVGSIGFFIEPPTDNESQQNELGYLVEIESVNSFHFALFLDSDGPVPVKAIDGVVWVNFNDKPKELFDAEFTISAVDKAGNISEKSSPIRLTDSGTGGGCSTAGSGSGSLILLLLTALWIQKRNRSN